MRGTLTIRRRGGVWTLVAVAVATAIGAGGCSTVATINRWNGPTIQGTIDGSDERSLYVTTPAGPRWLIERSDVVDIEHPGKAEAALGLVTVAGGLLMLAVGYAGKNPSGFVGIPRLFGWSGLAIGVGLTVGGSGSYLHSRQAAAAP